MLLIPHFIRTPSAQCASASAPSEAVGLMYCLAQGALNGLHQPAGRTGGNRREDDLQDKARQAVKAGDYDLAHALIRSGLRSKSRPARDEWRIIEAELEYARKDYPRAGLAAMRVVILSPQSKRVGIALYWAGRAYERIGRVGKAIELYEECVDHRTADEKLQARAERRLSKLAPDRKPK